MKKFAVVMGALLLSGCIGPIPEQTDNQLCFGLGLAESPALRGAILTEMQGRSDKGTFTLTPAECKRMYVKGISSLNSVNSMSATMIEARQQPQ